MSRTRNGRVVVVHESQSVFAALESLERGRYGIVTIHRETHGEVYLQRSPKSSTRFKLAQAGLASPGVSSVVPPRTSTDLAACLHMVRKQDGKSPSGQDKTHKKTDSLTVLQGPQRPGVQCILYRAMIL